ncbi:MAG: hypothetical protein CSA49_02910 [Gammaproteobacteria bacterium]|nr:MAG: hypothetical protein CSA49_02910 [Gammaproteobacteria bacterium]
MDFDPEQFLDYYEFAAEIKKVASVASAAEAHGILIGQLSGGLKLDGLMWLKQFLMGIGVKREPAEDQRNWFYQFHELTGKALADPELKFQLLLPDDDDPLTERLEAVGDWCSGFLVGFASTGHEQLPDDIAAAIKDLTEITKIDIEIDGEVGFAEENAYCQLVEYLKTVALLIYTEYGLSRQPLHTMQTGDDIPPTLH